MAKTTKTQAKNKLEAILNKAASLAFSPNARSLGRPLSPQDYIAIEKIVNRALSRLK